jgi:hypothetical protein
MAPPRTEERIVGDRVTFRVGRIVYVGISPVGLQEIPLR